MREAIKEIFVHPMQRVPGVLYEPEETAARNRIAVLVMHSDEDYLDFSTGPELAARGFTALCANTMQKEGTVPGGNWQNEDFAVCVPICPVKKDFSGRSRKKCS